MTTLLASAERFLCQQWASGFGEARYGERGLIEGEGKGGACLKQRRRRRNMWDALRDEKQWHYTDSGRQGA